MTKTKSECVQKLACIDSLRSRLKKKFEQQKNEPIKKISNSKLKGMFEKILNNQPIVLLKKNYNYETGQFFNSRLNVPTFKNDILIELSTPKKVKFDEFKKKNETTTPKIEENKTVFVNQNLDITYDFLNFSFFENDLLDSCNLSNCEYDIMTQNIDFENFFN